jgi:hypothetical protein
MSRDIAISRIASAVIDMMGLCRNGVSFTSHQVISCVRTIIEEELDLYDDDCQSELISVTSSPSVVASVKDSRWNSTHTEKTE